MTLSNMRENGVRKLAVYCGGRYCYHAGVIDVAAFADDIPRPSFGATHGLHRLRRDRR